MPKLTDREPVDELILYAIDQGITFPVDAKRFDLYRWAAAALAARAQNPEAWLRGGLAKITEPYFPQPLPPTSTST